MALRKAETRVGEEGSAAFTLINFSHPFTEEQLQELQQAVDLPLERVIDRPAQFDENRSFSGQGRELVEAVGLSPGQWQSTRLVLSLPGHQVIAALVLAELHGRSGQFPTVVRLQRNGGPAPVFRVAEVIDLQEVRTGARRLRGKR